MVNIICVFNIFFSCLLQNTNYGKKSGGWNSTTTPTTGSGWSRQSSMSRKQSIVDANELTSATSGLNITKSSTNRVIRIINNFDHTVQVSAEFILFNMSKLSILCEFTIKQNLLATIFWELYYFSILIINLFNVYIQLFKQTKTY